MSSLSDMMSSALAMMMSAAFVHFGVTGGSTPDQKAQTPPAAHASVSSSSSSDAPPVPTDDDRFSAPMGPAANAAPPHVARARRNS